MSRLFHARRNMQKRLVDLLDNPSRELIEDLGLKASVGDAGEDEDGDPKAAGAPAQRSGR